MEEQEPQDVDEAAIRTMDVTSKTNLGEGVYWTLNEEATAVILYDAITSRQLTNVVAAHKTFQLLPTEDGTPLMSVILEFSTDVDDPDAKRIKFAGDILHLEYVDEESDDQSGEGEGGQGEDESESGEGDSSEGDETGEESEGEGDSGEGDSQGEGDGEEGDDSGEGQGEGEGESGSGGKPTKVTEEDRKGSKDAREGGGNVDHDTPGKVKVGRRRLEWVTKP